MKVENATEASKVVVVRGLDSELHDACDEAVSRLCGTAYYRANLATGLMQAITSGALPPNVVRLLFKEGREHRRKGGKPMSGVEMRRRIAREFEEREAQR